MLFRSEIIFGVYPLFSYAIAAFWLGIGLTSIVNVPVEILALQSPGRFIPIVLAVLIVGATLSANAVWNFRQNDYWARWYAVTVLDSLPHDAILFTDGLAEGAIAYLNKIEGYRNDVTLYSVRGALFNNRLFNQLKDDNVQSINAINEFIKTETRPVYYISNLLHDHGIEYNGLYYKVLKSQETNFVHIVIMPRVLAYLKYILAIEPHDPWEKIHRTVILGNGCYLLTAYAENPGQNMQDIGYLKNLRNKLCDNLAGSYVIINKIMDSPLPDWNMVRLLLEKAEKQSNEAMLKSSISNLDYYRGVMYLRTGDNDKGRYFLEQSLAKWNHPENKAKSELAKIKK